MAKTVKVEVNFETGDVEVRTEGYEGKECYKDSAAVEAALGKAIDTKATSEAYKGKQKEVQRRV